MKQLLLIGLTFILIISGCKSKEGLITEGSCDSCEDAIVRFLGDPALDGCGWVVKIASKNHTPTNLPPEYTIDGLEVRIKYKTLDLVNCGMLKDAHHAILLEEIKKKD